MSRLRLSASAIWLASFAASCGGEATSNDGVAGGSIAAGGSAGGAAAPGSTAALGVAGTTGLGGAAIGASGAAAVASTAGGAATGASTGAASSVSGAEPIGAAGTGGVSVGQTGAGATASDPNVTSSTGGMASGMALAGAASVGQNAGAASTNASAAAGGAPASAGATASDAGGAGGAAVVVGAAGMTSMAGAAGAAAVTPSTPAPSLVTSSDNNYWQIGEVTEMAGGGADITVNDAATYQTWLGFGGTFNEAGWDALSVVDAAERNRAIRLLFGAEDGANFAWGRLPMGASDYAMDRYSLAETANDLNMDSFSIERDRQLLIPYIKAALAVKPDVHLWASPWSPPAWMKDNNNLNGLMDGAEAHMKEDGDILKAYALYFARFVEEYAAEGLTIEHVQPQNEPGYATRYPSCLWTSQLLTTFVRDHLGPTLAERVPGTGIWFGTMSRNDSDNTDDDDVRAIMSDSEASAFITGIGLQWNMQNYTAGYIRDFNVPVMQTEHKCGNYPWDWSEPKTPEAHPAPNDYAYGEESWGLIRDWIESGVSIYSAWNMILDTTGHNLDYERAWPQNALLTVDRSAGKLNVTAAYYVFRHVSQYVQPGAVRLATTGGDALAFKNPDGSFVTIMYNSGGASATTLAVAGTTLQFDMPARGWATVNWQ